MSILATESDDFDWAHMVEANGPGLRRLIAARMANQELVEDALQETYLRAVRSRQWPDRRWLRTVARRASTDVYRGEPPPASELDALALAADVVLPGSDEHLDGVDRRLALRWALARLSPRHRRLLALRGVHDLTYHEIGAIEGLSEEAVTAALNRARVRLRTHLAAYEARRVAPAPAVAWVGYLLRRLRWRLQTVGPRVYELAGATFTIGVVAIAVGVPARLPARARPSVVAGASTGIAYVTDAGGGSSVAGAPGGAAARTPVSVGQRAVVPPIERPLLSGHPDVHVGPDEATLRYTLEVNDPTGGNATELTLEIHCDKGRAAASLCPLLATLAPPP